MLDRFSLEILRCTLALCLALPATPLAARQRPASNEGLTITSVNEAQWQNQKRPNTALLIRLQILLDRAHISPGVIDGTFGENSRKAIEAVRQISGLEPSDHLDEQLWRMLVEKDSEPALVTYEITDKDVAGPFVKSIPKDFRKKAEMQRLGYTSAEELLAEKFHMSQELLRKLNPGATFDQSGEQIVIANVERQSLPSKIARLEINARQQRVRAYDNDDKIVAIYPATVGSDDRPSPKGEFKVTEITENPVYRYDPALHLRGVHVKEKLKIPPGPNNPVGSVWIDLSAEGYGIHGTPDPDKISKSASHGCIRLTNWDAVELAKHLSKGTRVVITDSEKISELPVGDTRPSVAVDIQTAPPLPERNPVRAGKSVEQTPPLPGEVATIPWTDAEVAAAKAKCTEALSSIKLDYKLLPPIKEGLCGAPAPILLKSLGSDTKVEIDPPATLTCALARALSTWLNESVQPEAEVLFSSQVVKLYNATSYACRNRYGSASQPLSEHARANALDVSEFVLASGEHITVLDGWPKVVSTPPAPVPNPAREPEVKTAKPTGEKASVVTAAKAKAVAPPSPPPVASSEPTPNPKAEFVKHVHDEACHEFGTVLGPEANAAHKNHFHLDMKERRRTGFCQ
jgi:lipoprotein-anchoring transpeptidase ErfK/SrfK